MTYEQWLTQTDGWAEAVARHAALVRDEQALMFVDRSKMTHFVIVKDGATFNERLNAMLRLNGRRTP